MKLHRLSEDQVVFHCPGCACGHAIPVKIAKPVQRGWEWNGSMDLPTFAPSILVNGNAELNNPMVPRCHSYVTNGKIHFLDDCTHSLKGKIVELPEWEE